MPLPSLNQGLHPFVYAQKQRYLPGILSGEEYVALPGQATNSPMLRPHFPGDGYLEFINPTEHPGLIGTPVPVVGAFIGALLGTVAGAFALTWHQTRHTAGAARASMGALLGRAVAIGLKVFVGLVIIAIGGASLLLG